MDKKKEWTGPLPPAGDTDVGKEVFRILGLIVRDKANLGLSGPEGRIERNYALRAGQHWRNKSKKVPLIAANLIYTHTQRTVNMLTDNNPTFNVIPLGDVDMTPPETYTDIQAAAEHWWNETEQQDSLARSITQGEQYGITVEKVAFNPDLEYGMGEVETILVDPLQFGWYPTDLTDPADLQQCDAVLHYYPLSISEVRRRWPDKADQIKSDNEMVAEMGVDRRGLQQSGSSGSIMTTLSSVVTEIGNWFGGSSVAGEDEDERCLIVECWSRDRAQETVETVSLPDSIDSYSSSQTTQDVYAGNVRYTVVCNAGKVVLEDRSNPNVNSDLPHEVARRTYLYDKYPFSAANSVIDTSSAWGMSEYQQMSDLVREFNKSLSQLVLIKDRAARAKLINPKTSGVENSAFTSYPGFINPKNSMEAASIRYLESPPVPVDITNAISLFKELTFLVVGTFDLDSAQSAGKNVIAYKAIAALMERAATMMRGKIRSYSRLIRERGRMYVSHVQNFYLEERWIPVSRRDGGEEMKRFRGADARIPLKLTVVNGSTMPVSRVAQREEALALFQSGAIDNEELLEKLDWSGRTELTQRMKAGPYGELFRKLQIMGTPPNIIQTVQQLAGMEAKEFDKQAQQGNIPHFMAMLQQAIAQQMQGGQPAPDPEKVKAEAEAQRISAEAELTKEKIETERILQLVKKKGIEFDQEKLEIERAKVTKDLLSPEPVRGDVGMPRTPPSRNKPGYNESGLTSNNEGEEQ